MEKPQTAPDAAGVPYNPADCQLHWYDAALSPLSALENVWRFGMRRLNGLRRRLGLSPPASAPRSNAQAHVPSWITGGHLSPGDLVIVLPVEEIRATLDADGKCDGLKFMRTMERYCGKTFRVMKRVRYVLDEHAHKMLKSRNVVLLDGVICEGKGVYGREGCDRSCFFFWKEAWLRKLEPPSGRGPGA